MTQEIAAQKTRLPWPSVLVLAGASLLMVTAEMLPTAVLAPMSTGLGTTEAVTGVLVSLWAAVVVIASFPLSRLTRRRPARSVIVVALLAVVRGGGTLGMVVGTPLARLVTEASDWRVAFAGLGALLVVASAVSWAVLPRMPRGGTPESPDDAGSDRARPAAASGRTRTSAGGELAVVAAWVGFALIGHYGAYTFITRLAEPAAELSPGGTSGMLLLFGIASALGVAVAARVERRTARALVVSVGLTGLAVGALELSAAPAVSVVVVLWGAASGAFAQTLILRIAGETHRAFAGALIPVLFNGGIAVGTGSGLRNALARGRR